MQQKQVIFNHNIDCMTSCTSDICDKLPSLLIVLVLRDRTANLVVPASRTDHASSNHVDIITPATDLTSNNRYHNDCMDRKSNNLLQSFFWSSTGI